MEADIYHACRWKKEKNERFEVIKAKETSHYRIELDKRHYHEDVTFQIVGDGTKFIEGEIMVDGNGFTNGSSRSYWSPLPDETVTEHFWEPGAPSLFNEDEF